MKLPDTLKTQTAQRVFETVFILVVLLLLPSLRWGKYGGGIAMLVASAGGLIAYLTIYGERLRRGRQLAVLALSMATGAIIAVSLALLSTH